MNRSTATMSASVLQPGPLAARWAGAFYVALVEHRLYLGLIGAFYLCGWAAAWLAGGTAAFDTRLMADGYVIILASFAVGLGIGHALWAMFWVRPEGSLIRFIARDYRERFLNADTATRFLIASAPLPLFMSVFSSLKRMIPYANPYGWDADFAEWDRALHFGTHPWEWLHPLLGEPVITSAVNAAYHAWFFALFFCFIWQCLSRRDPLLRMRFLLSFLLCWMVLGSVLATAFASGGPVYYGRLTGLDDPYAPLFAYLYDAAQHVPIWALDVQERLWATYVDRGTELGHGISAMPSLHVAVAVLMACLGWSLARWAGWALAAFAVVIQIGSVHLGWHYAIDGYVSTVCVLLIWAASRPLARWVLAPSATTAPRAAEADATA